MTEGNILESLGSEIVGIVTPVSICMLLVVLLVQSLTPHGSDVPVASIAMLVYDEQPTDSFTEKLGGAMLNALVFVIIVTVVTFLLVVLFYFRCTKFLRAYMGFSAFMVLAYMGGGVAVLLIQNYSIPIDAVSFLVMLYNFATVGVLAVFFSKMPIFVTQGYLVLIGVLVAYWFTMLPEWTTWVLLMAMALYDVVAVLLPGGPLNMLVELAIERDEDIPALIYEARPNARHIAPLPNSPHPVSISSSASDSAAQATQIPPRWRRRVVTAPPPGNASSAAAAATQLPSNVVNEPVNNQDTVRPIGISALRIESQPQPPGQAQALAPPHSTVVMDGLETSSRTAGRSEIINIEALLEDVAGNGESGVLSAAIKLGLGDFIFYSVLVGRAAMYDMTTVYACYLAIVAGLGSTLVLLTVWRRALPALPISITLGVIFYLLTRFLVDPFIVNLSTHYVYF
ncbi:hypothetical protein R1sor_017721 [Riccia sorocarpa]|uniref:Presenilin n=1 Tax=Riccia sorocarpa TaxID=122646 RepID=A0ABD3I9H7_9MARC